MFFDVSDNHILLRVRLSPNSSCCAVKGVFSLPDGDYLKISVVNVPEKGKANKELIDFLAKKLKLAKSDFEIIGGELDRYKKILINKCNEDVLEVLNELSKNN